MLLQSDWFYRMLERQATTPEDRLVAIFSIAGQWISAPGIRESLQEEGAAHIPPRLKTYIADTAVAVGANDPHLLAAQLHILLQGALAEELRDPSVGALDHAGKAARAVVLRACQSYKKQQIANWSAVGGLMFALGVLFTWLMMPASQHSLSPAEASIANRSPNRTVLTMPTGVSPGDMEAALKLQDQIERGYCPAPQLLELPEGQVTAYMNVIHFRTPENPAADRRNLHNFLSWFKQTRATECYYPPVNGHTLVKWSS